MPTREGNAMFALHRYFLTASTMRATFLDYLGAHPIGAFSLNDRLFPEFIAHMSVWYATLFTAWEGWRQLQTEYGTAYPGLDEAWADPRRRLLQDYRNATMHYSRQYMDDRLTAFATDEGAAHFAHAVHLDLGDAILAELDRLAEH
jgi:hypothetical protein